ncbi:MAG: poly-gamma-glutamate synthase PgsB [Candidatus Aminicenantes bacterium]
MGGSLLAFLVFYFVVERFRIIKTVRSIPLRICVTGTRGKSSVARLIAACLREAGFTVLARTTGSKPVIIFPDGKEREILRRGSPSILEGKKLLKFGAELKVDALVSELMSIHPECSFVESVQMYNPHILVITNVRLDHLAQMGSTRQDIARCFACSFPENGTVFVPQEEFYPVFEKSAQGMNTRIVRVDGDSLQEYSRSVAERLPNEFEENIRLVLALAEFLKIDTEIVFQGLKKAQPDFGSFKMWTMDVGVPPRRLILVNSFAANDPESTRRILSRLMKKDFLKGKNGVGLLNLRRDRGDRTIQWLKSLGENTFPEFRKIFLIGEHASAFKKKLKGLVDMESFILKSMTPKGILEEISETVKAEVVLFGMGNMGGAGRELVEYWEDRGEPYDF